MLQNCMTIGFPIGGTGKGVWMRSPSLCGRLLRRSPTGRIKPLTNFIFGVQRFQIPSVLLQDLLNASRMSLQQLRWYHDTTSCKLFNRQLIMSYLTLILPHRQSMIIPD